MTTKQVGKRLTKIEWTDATWNAVRGCREVSPGCARCYAKRFAERFRGTRGHPYEHGFDVRLVPHMLAWPFSLKRPMRLFVNSMSDVFQEDVPDWYVEKMFRVMAAANWLTFQVLTKRPDRMRSMLSGSLNFAASCPNIWLGVSVENRQHGLPRLELLQETPAALRFLSAEPLLEDLGELNLSGVSWVITGGESGPKSRTMDPAWALNIMRQCREQGVRFFHKQNGGLNKAKTGRKLGGRVYDEIPAIPLMPVPSGEDRWDMASLVDAWVEERFPKGAELLRRRGTIDPRKCF